MRGPVILLTIVGSIACGSDTRPSASASSGSSLGSAPVEEPLEAVGARTFVKKGCEACHTLDDTPKVGPSLRAAFGRKVKLVNGDEVVFDEAYFRESLVSPNAKVVAGFPPSQPSYEGQLNEREVAGLIAYLRSVK
jgi:cytochrome c oxidase subunit 2